MSTIITIHTNIIYDNIQFQINSAYQRVKNIYCSTNSITGCHLWDLFLPCLKLWPPRYRTRSCPRILDSSTQHVVQLSAGNLIVAGVWKTWNYSGMSLQISSCSNVSYLVGPCGQWQKRKKHIRKTSRKDWEQTIQTVRVYDLKLPVS